MKAIDVLKLCFLLVMPLILIGHAIERPTSGASDDSDNRLIYRYKAWVPLWEGAGQLIVETEHNLVTIDIPTDGQNQLSTYYLSFSEGDIYNVKANNLNGDASFTSLGLGDGDEFDIILAQHVIAESPGVFFNANYKFRVADIKVANSSTGPSMAGYILSGGSDGSESISTPGTLNVYLNSDLIYSGGDGLNNPITFNALDGDRLKIVVNNVNDSGTMDKLWLHRPSGYADMISYYVEFIPGSEFSATFLIN